MAKVTSSFCSADEGQCVEVEALVNGDIAVSDSKDPGGAPLVFSPTEWDAFIEGAKNGQFDYDRLAGREVTV